MTAHPRRRLLRGPIGYAPNRDDTEKVILIIAEAATDPCVGSPWDDLAGAVVVGYPQFSAETLTDIDPDVVVTALVSHHFDGTDVAWVLSEAAFTGEFRLLSGPLPHPTLVSDELRRTFPQLDIDLWLLPDR